MRNLLLLLACATAAFAQKSTGEIQGTVFDPSNTVVPKASVVATDVSTGIAKTTESGADGAYLVPNLLAGTYDVAVTAPGFQKAVYSGVIVETGRTTNLALNLKVGTVTETVEVSASSTQIETTSNQISATIRNDHVQDLPFNGRDMLGFALLTAGASQSSNNASTFDGLPPAALNISVDGTNINDTRYRSGAEGFSTKAPLRLDAIEEVTITTAGTGADAAAGGAMTIRFSTKRGTSQYHGTLFEQFRNDALNAGDFFNNMRGIAKPKVRVNDFGGAIGGPLKLPFAPFLRNKLFFFANLEYAPRPSSSNPTANLLTEEAQRGTYRFVGTDGLPHTIDVLQLAGMAGYPRAIDPTVSATLAAINATRSKGVPRPSSSNLYQETLQWRQNTGQRDIYPTARLDYQVNDKIAWHVSWNLRHNHADGDGPPYPGLGLNRGENKMTNYALSNGVDWTVTPSLFSSLRFGVQSSIYANNIRNSVNQWSGQGDKRIDFGSGIAALIPNATPLIRGNPAYTINQELNWVRGKHSLKFGGNLLYTRFYESDFYQFSGVLNYSLNVTGTGVASTDPVNSVFTAANIPFIRTQDIPTAAALYATLTGRVSQVRGFENINEKTRQYEKFAPLVYRENYRSWGMYLQDSYRLTPHLTLNYGLRWEFTGVMTNTNNTFMSPRYEDLLAPSGANFQPGVFDANRIPAIDQRSITYRPDHNNAAPNFGFAWNPVAEGLLGKLLGKDGKTVIRGSYGVNYFDEGLNVDYWVNTNAGNWRSISATPGAQFAPGSLSLQSPAPDLLIAPPSFAPPFSMRQFAFQGYNVGTTAGMVERAGGGLPKMRTPYVQNWTLGIQREIVPGTAFEIRYVGNKTTHKWHLYGIQEINIFENGFLNEFINAKRNLDINAAAGVTSFQNRGLAGQVPLPIFEAAFAARGNCPNCGAIPANFTSTTFINPLRQGTAGAAAATLAGGSNPTYICRLVGSSFLPCLDQGFNAPGPYPMNFFVPNPYVADLTITDDLSYQTYNGLQVELRRRVRSGLNVTANYTLAHSLGDMYAVSNTLTNYYTTIRNRDLDKGPTAFDVRHAFQAYGTYDLPIGKGRRFAISNGVLDRIVGGWTISGIYKLTSGRVSKLTSGIRTVNNNSNTDSGVILNGISLADLERKLRIFSDGPVGTTLYNADRSLVGADGRANPQYLALPSTPGVFGQYLYIHGPRFFSADMALRKDIPIKERFRLSFQGEFLNFLNHPVFNPGTFNINNTSFGQTSSVAVGARTIQLRGYLRW